MNTTVFHPIHLKKEANTTKSSIITRFFTWSKGQEKNRLLWLSIALAGHGCVFTILTMFAVLFSGNNFIYWPFAIAAMAMNLVVNLAAMPTKITIPIFFFSLLIDAVIIALCAAQGFDVSGTYI